MTKLEQEIVRAMTETGRANEGWRFKIQAIENPAYSDRAVVVGTLTKTRCRNPIMGWELIYYKPKNQILWDESKFMHF